MIIKSKPSLNCAQNHKVASGTGPNDRTFVVKYLLTNIWFDQTFVTMAITLKM